MKEKGLQHVNVYEGDTADSLARKFCREHKISDREKQYKLLKSLEYQIDQHRNPPMEDNYEEAFKEDDREELDPNIKKKVLEIFNEIWYEYDEEEGQIGMERYKQILKFAKRYKRIPDHKNPDKDHFSDKNLERLFHEEDQVKYSDQDKVDGKISHRSVMYIAHDIFVKIKREQEDKAARKRELQEMKRELTNLKQQQEQYASNDDDSDRQYY